MSSQQEILQLGLDHFVAVSLITRVRVRYGVRSGCQAKELCVIYS